MEINSEDAPFLFREEKSHWASTSAELLASLAALHAFGWLEVDNSRKSLSWTLTGGTDNLANQFLTAKSQEVYDSLAAYDNQHASESLLGASFSFFEAQLAAS